MSLCFDFSNQLRQTFRDPAEHEKGRARFVFLEEREESLGALLHTQLAVVPIARLDNPAQIVNTKPVFQIDRNSVLHSRHLLVPSPVPI